MRGRTVLLGVVLVLSALALAPHIPTAEAQTVSWYLRDTSTSVPTSCSSANLDLSQTAGSSLVEHTGHPQTVCWYTPAMNTTITSGDWVIEVWLRKSASGGGNPDATLNVHIVDADGSNAQLIMTRTQALSSDVLTEFVFTETGVAQQTLSDQRIRFQYVSGTAGGGPQLRTSVIGYNAAEGSTGDTKVILPEDVLDPCDALTVALPESQVDLFWDTGTATQTNLAPAGQDAETPALTITNDGPGTCDITLFFLTDPPDGVTVKANTDNDPTGASTVPTDPSTLTICAGLESSTTCEVWLWSDLEHAGPHDDVSRTLRVESVPS